MAFQQDDDDDGSFAFANAQWVDTNPEDELESNVYQSNREYTIFAIDCHGCNYLKPVPTKNLRSVDPKQSKIIISQLENIIQAIINYLRSHIIQSPDAQHAVFFYNTSERNQNGIHILEFQNGKQMHTLSKDYILQLMGLENLMDFHHKIGLSDKLEGSTPFTAVIDTIQTIFRDAITPGISTQHLDRKVLLFTPFENPPLMPYQICLRRCNILQEKSCTFRGQTKSLITIQQECVSDAHRTVTLLDAHRDHSEITWILFPLQNSFPDLYRDLDKADDFKEYNLLHSNTSLSQLSQLSQNSIDSSSQSQLSNNGGSLASQQQQQAPVYAGSLAAKQHVSLNSGGIVNPQHGLMDKYNFTPEILINSLNFGPDLEWMKSAFASSIATNSQSQSTQATQNNNTNKNTQQQSPMNIKDFYQTTLSTQQASLPPDAQQRLNRKITKLTFSPTYFESIFPECAVSEHIRAYQTQIRDLKELNQIKQYKKRALVTVPFYLPMKPYDVGVPTPDQAVFFGVDIFPQFIETKPQVTTDVKLEPTNYTPIQSTTRQLSITGEEITADDICHWFPMGAKEALFINRTDVAQIKRFGPSSIRVLGFKEHDGTYANLMNKGLSIADNIQRPYLCYPNESKYPGSGVLFGDLVQMCYVSNRFIVAQFIPKLGAIPRLVYLLPVLETRHVDDDGNNDRMITPTCFQLIFAPFQEDIRSIDGMLGYSPDHPIIPEVEDALGLVLDAYQQKTVGTKGNEVQTNNLFDLLEDLPSMHKMACRIAVTEHLALGIPLQLPEDQLALGLEMKHIDPIVEDAYAIITEHLPGIGVEKVKATRGKKAAATTTGGDDGDGDSATTKKTAAKKPTAASKRKANADAENSDDDNGTVSKTTVKKAVRGKKVVDSDDDNVKAEPKTTTKRATTTRKTTKVESESDNNDNGDDDDDDQPKKSTRGRKPAATKATKATTTTTTGRGRKAAVKTEMNDNSDDDEEEEEVKPKRKATASRRGKKVSSSDDDDEDDTPPVKPTRKTARKFIVSSSEEEEEESEVEEKPKRGRKPAVKKEVIESDDDDKPVRRGGRTRK